ncbi:DUF305 domain-containing protein [Sporichthya brevicatena]|uniref:DUF305 domain-containing protein n=1 Tax=Sporichthya brevicatena TaxID=171442 RepID=A0ABN1H9U5_9ACTN
MWTRTALIGVAAFASGALTFAQLDRGEAAPAYPATTSAEASFTREMQTHHAQAIEMATFARDRSPDPQIQEIAFDLALSQQQEIGQMRALLAVWGLPSTGPAASAGTGGHHAGAVMRQEDIDVLGTIPPKDVGVRFLQLMIPHHEAGIAMARDILARTDDLALRDLATSILQVQQHEITLMKDLLRQRGVRTPAA